MNNHPEQGGNLETGVKRFGEDLRIRATLALSNIIDSLPHIKKKNVGRALVAGAFGLLEVACDVKPVLPPTSTLRPEAQTAIPTVKPTASPTPEPIHIPVLPPTFTPSVTYDIATNSVVLTPPLEPMTPSPTVEAAHPTELGTLDKVKFGKTEITAGTDITFEVNLSGVNTPVRMVASDRFGDLHIQASTWYTQTIGGKAPKEILRQYIEDMLNARPTGTVWGTTNGNGRKETEIKLPPGTKIVLIAATHEELFDSGVPEDPTANNFKVAIEYDSRAHELRAAVAGMAEDNIRRFLQKRPEWTSDFDIFSQILTDWSSLMAIIPPVTDESVINPDQKQTDLFTTIYRMLDATDPARGFIHFRLSH